MWLRFFFLKKKRSTHTPTQKHLSPKIFFSLPFLWSKKNPCQNDCAFFAKKNTHHPDKRLDICLVLPTSRPKVLIISVAKHSCNDTYDVVRNVTFFVFSHSLPHRWPKKFFLHPPPIFWNFGTGAPIVRFPPKDARNYCALHQIIFFDIYIYIDAIVVVYTHTHISFFNFFFFEFFSKSENFSPPLFLTHISRHWK